MIKQAGGGHILFQDHTFPEFGTGYCCAELAHWDNVDVNEYDYQKPLEYHVNLAVIHCFVFVSSSSPMYMY